MKRFEIQFIIVLLVASMSLGFYGCKGGTQDTGGRLLVFAAASLSDVVSELIDSFEMKTGVAVNTNFASSGTLAQQIARGGNADIYLSANTVWADHLDSLGFFIKGSKSILARNDLVLIAPANSEIVDLSIDASLDLASLLGDGRLSIGDPSHVPAGRYGKQALQYFGWYVNLSDKVLPAKDVRDALMLVEMEETPLGVVYRTDAEKSKKVKIVGVFPDHSHDAVEYIGGLCRDRIPAKEFFAYLRSQSSSDIWQKYGFKR